MNIQRSTLACTALLAASMSTTYAGPCSQEIIRVEEMIEARLQAKARGAQAPESTAAKMHRQPTPDSIAAAEVKLGLISQEQVNTVKTAMARARDADGAGDQKACEQALADVKRLLDSAGTQTNDARR
jgi:hypothetical protein